MTHAVIRNQPCFLFSGRENHNIRERCPNGYFLFFFFFTETFHNVVRKSGKGILARLSTFIQNFGNFNSNIGNFFFEKNIYILITSK